MRGYTRERTPTIGDGVVIRYRLTGTGYVNPPEVSASRNGVCIAGVWPTLSMSDLTLVRGLLQFAEADHRALARGEDVAA